MKPGCAWVCQLAMALGLSLACANETGRWIGKSTGNEIASGGDALETGPLADWLAKDAMDFLFDPNKQLSAGAMVERTEFLRHHAEESKIRLRAMVLNRPWLPIETSGFEWKHEDRFEVVALYPMGEPSSASLYFSPLLASGISAAEQHRALQSAVIQATGKEDPEDQLQAFLTQLSIRLYWMERMLDGDVAEPATHITVAPGEPKRGHFNFPALNPLSAIAPWLAGGSLIAISLPVGWWLIRKRAQYRFPEFDADPRLGGSHAAGVGAVISYLNPKVPPAAQREPKL